MSQRSEEQLGLELDSQPLPDEAARARIAGDLGTNFLVEAGAGSGKTTALVSRMVALVRTGTVTVREVAAVTFTRKTAGELRQRFQKALEKDRWAPERTPDQHRLLDRALQDIDQAFMGTIHAFCARLLRERPLEAGVDPAFAETTAAEANAEAARFWSLHLERLATQGDAILGELDKLGLTPAQLRSLYEELREYPDVEFPLDPAPPPDPADVAVVRTELESLLNEGALMMPKDEPAGGWDKMQRRLRSLLYQMRHGRWNDDRHFLDMLADATAQWELVQKRWAADQRGKEDAVGLRDRLVELTEAGSAAQTVLDQWWAHRYPTAMRFAKGAADALMAQRRSLGRLDFQDLLYLAARMLRRNPTARADLGHRWRRLLVDEFQDTDPLQAEVLFLLASDCEDEGDWTRSQPRPGALFVVGDPKQSIYRFRRSDIAMYSRVRHRFEDFGAVLTLTSNFRSGAPIAALVNEVFAPPDGFPAVGDETQAGFAPLDPQPHRQAPPREGVFHFTVNVTGKVNKDTLTAWESNALAEWIAGQVKSGVRAPDDFLILTRTKGPLASFVRALERHGLPVQVSGAGVGVEEEVAELTLLLEALTDPSDTTLTVAVLIGLCFGLDHEQLLLHREAGKWFDLRRADRNADPSTVPVEAALAQMRSWWELARVHPADVVVGRIADDLGLLAYAAAGELGSIRAGALAFVLDAVRSSGLEGDTSLTGAQEALAAALAAEEAEAPLEPGRRGVIRLMNLHKAKGLEAPVVVLAAPFGNKAYAIKRHLERTPEGRARGWLVVQQKDSFNSIKTVARPRGWADKEERERVFEDAEDLRLLYVAVTRAGHELVVSRPPKNPEGSPWGALEGWLEENGTRLELDPIAPPPRERLASTAEDITAAVAATTTARSAATAPGFRFLTVTGLVKSEDEESAPAADVHPLQPRTAGPGGYDWGSAVHGVLEAAARGRTGEHLRAVGRSLLFELDRPTRSGEPTELDDLITTVQAVQASDLWRRAGGATRRLAEVPFALRLEGSTFLEGVVDLAFPEDDGWVLADYKTDRGDDPEFAVRRRAYRKQLRAYSSAWSRLTGESVKERVILWARNGTEERV
jgi:ATP-dependent helicase/nuclease subunit A